MRITTYSQSIDFVLVGIDELCIWVFVDRGCDREQGVWCQFVIVVEQ